MKRDERLEKLLHSVELVRSTVDAANAQLRALEAQVRELMHGKQLGSPEVLEEQPQSISHMPVSRNSTARAEKMLNASTTPMEVPPRNDLLHRVPCPDCGSPMLWRANRREGKWFAGCSRFAGQRNGCRGTRTREEVEKGFRKLSVVPLLPTATDIALQKFSEHAREVAVKHHGEEAVAEAEANGDLNSNGLDDVPF